MEKQKKSIGTVVLVVLLLIVTVASLILATFAWARYTTTSSGDSTAYVAEWDVAFASNNDTFNETFTYVAPGKVAPGTSGNFSMTLNSANTQVAYDYRIILTHLQNKPTNLHFYTKAPVNGVYNPNSEILFDGTNGNSGSGIDIDPVTEQPAASGRVYGHVDLQGSEGAAKATASKTITIYWNWAYRSTEVRTINGATNNSKIPTYTYSKVLQQLETYCDVNDITVSYANDATDEQKITALIAAINDTTISAPLVNDAIDTVDGEASAAEAVANNSVDGTEMSLKVEFTAIQCDPTSGQTEFTPYVLNTYSVTAPNPPPPEEQPELDDDDD